MRDRPKNSNRKDKYPTGPRGEQSKFQAIVADADEGIIVLEDRGIIGYVNAAAEFLLGRRQSELTGEMFGLPLAPSEDTVTINVVAQDSSVRLVELRIERLDQCEPLPLVVRLKDITDYDRKVSDARDQVRRRDEFLAMLSHELRNPLAAIQSATQLLCVDSIGKDFRREANEILERQLSHLTRILDDLLDISRITRGKVLIEKEAVDLQEVIADALEAATPLITSRGHALRINVPQCPFWVQGDATRLEQIIVNLLNNAAKFTPDGGNMAITVEETDDLLCLIIEDDGPGIPEELRPYVFESFVQGEQSIARSDGGLGIGLSLVKTFVELHGGTVSIESAEKGGAMFTVKLPRLRVSEPPDVARAKGSVARQIRIALIEDNHDARRPLKQLLECEGHIVSEADNGVDGLAILLDERPDIALVDIGLPKMNGYEIVEQLRNHDAGRTVRAYALTGYGRPEDQEATERVGFDGHFVKPVCLEKLRELLVECRRELEETSAEGTG